MKKLMCVILIAGLTALSSQAQQNDYVASNSNSSVKQTVINDSSKTYLYEVYGSIPASKSVFEEEHFLGGDLTAKWNSFNQNYTQMHDVKVGFTSSTVEINKPSIYNAVIKVNNYFKKATRKAIISREEAVIQLGHIFDCANVICFNQSTVDLERAIDRAKTPEEIISIFDKVTIKIIK